MSLATSRMPRVSALHKSQVDVTTQSGASDKWAKRADWRVRRMYWPRSGTYPRNITDAVWRWA